MRNFIIGILAAITILWIFFILAKPATTIKTVENTKVNQEDVEYQFGKDAYMDGCLGENGTYSDCNCSFEYMVKKIGMDKLVDISIKFNETGVIPQIMYDAVEYCQ